MAVRRKKEDSSFSEEKEAKRLLFLLLSGLIGWHLLGAWLRRRCSRGKDQYWRGAKMSEQCYTAISLLLSCGILSAVVATPGRAEEGDYILHSFQGTDGQNPVAPLIKVNGLFYGTTPNGGTDGVGVIYSMTPGGAFEILYNFGATEADAAIPHDALTYVNGVFYGTTSGGGSEKLGTVFSFTPKGAEKVLYSFKGSSLGSDPNDGYSPDAELFYYHGALYGTASEGSHGDGVIFKVTPDGSETIVHEFSGSPSDGGGPSGGLIESGGVLYGVTAVGGATGNGTVYSLTDSGAYRVVYSFQGGTVDGSYPSGDLLNVNGTLYGTTRQGGFYSKGGSIYGYGTVFAVTPSGAETVIHSFGFTGGKNAPAGGGQSPYAGLTEAGGLLYGTTLNGGKLNGGVVFSMTPQGAETLLHSSLFGVDGNSMYAGLKNGGAALYGVRLGGGVYGKGVVFRVKPLNR